MKKLLILIMIIGIFMLSGCGKKEENKESEKTTVAVSLSKVFKSEIKKSKDIEKVAEKISKSEIIVPETQVFTIGEDDYLTGFKEEIKGFKKAVGIAPMINTIPMIAYVFEVDNPAEFKKTLEDNAQLNWNICTVADEMKITIEGDYVFFIMSPESFEE